MRTLTGGTPISSSTRTTSALDVGSDDVTTLHFERDDEDDLRKVGMSNEHRIDPQVQAGLLAGSGGSRWKCTCSKATRQKRRR
jgi:hypothetical protein